MKNDDKYFIENCLHLWYIQFMKIRIVFFILMILSTFVMYAQETPEIPTIEEKLLQPRLSQSDITLNAYILSIEAVKSGNGKLLREILDTYFLLIPYIQYNIKYSDSGPLYLLQGLAAAINQNEEFLESFSPFSNSFIGFKQIFRQIVEPEAVSVLDKAKIALYKEIVISSGKLLPQVKKGSLSELWLYYFKGNVKTFYTIIWKDGRELSAVHAKLWAERKNANTSQYGYDFAVGYLAGAAIQLPINNSILPSHIFKILITQETVIDDAYISNSFFFNLKKEINDTFFVDGFNLIPVNDLFILTHSLQLGMGVLSPEYFINLIPFFDLRTNLAALEEGSHYSLSAGAGAGMDIRICFDRLQIFVLNLKISYYYNFFQDNKLPALKNHNFEFAVSIGGSSGLTDWKKTQQLYNEKHYITVNQ